MSDECVKESTLFVCDMITYFFKKYQIESTFDTIVVICDKSCPKKFTEDMGSIARYLALTKMDAVRHLYKDNSFCLKRNFMFHEKFSNGYNPEDFLHYCGLMGMSLIWNCSYGEFNYAYGPFIAIDNSLDKAIKDGQFFASGGWNALATYADKTIEEIRIRNLVERMLFAEDMIRYFMDRSRVERPESMNEYFDENRRWFTEVIGSVAWWLEKCPITPSRITRHENGQIISTAYHPRDLLQYCGIKATSSVRNFEKGNRTYWHWAVLEIFEHLEEILKGEYFHLLGGWNALATYAEETLREINIRSLEERTLFAEDMVRYFVERSQVPGMNGNFDGNRSMFTEVMGSVAWWLAHYPITPSRRTINVNGQIISTAYHPQDLLQYCGSRARYSVGNFESLEAAVRDIVIYLGEIYQDEHFYLSGGWSRINQFACMFQICLMKAFYQMHYRLAGINEEIEESDNDEALAELCFKICNL